MEVEKRNKLIELCQQLIKIPSYSGQEDKLVNKLKEVFEQYNFDEIYVDEYGSIIAKIKGMHQGPKILLDAHIDTVPVPDITKWRHNPFGGEIEDGKIYGRGASDMKGALSAMIAAGSYFSLDLKKDFSGELYIAGVVHEECFEGVAARKISERVRPDYVIIGEASELNLKCGQRGRAEIIVEAYGKPAHSANPEKGINAVYCMTKLINEINKLECSIHEVLGKGILELTDIISSPYPGASVVPSYCRATYDRRLLIGETEEGVLKPIQNLIQIMEDKDSNFKAKVFYAEGDERCHTGEKIQGKRFFPGWLFDKNEEFVQTVWNGLKDMGMDCKITQYSFCTNGSHYAGEAGIKTIGFGPSQENLAHTIDEYIEVSQLIGAYEGYKKIIQTLSELI